MRNINDELVLVTKVYSLEEIKSIVKDIMAEYDIEQAYLFGSYARNEATENSDIDIMIKIRKDNDSFGLMKLSALENELMNAFGKKVDLITERTYTEEIKYNGENIKLAKELFYKNVRKDMIKIYG